MWDPKALWFFYFFLLGPKRAAATLTIVCIPDRQELTDRGSVSKKFPGDIHLFLIGHKCVTWVPLVVGASRKVGL